jgi:hypothetical protein
MSIQNIEVPNNLLLYCNSINIGNTGTPFQKYVQNAYGNTLTGACFTSPVTISGGLYRQLDRVFSLSFSATAATGTGVPSPITLGTALPNTNMWADMNFPIWVIENNITVPGTFNIAFGTGIATIYKNFRDPFSGVGITGYQGFSVTYGSFLI